MHNTGFTGLHGQIMNNHQASCMCQECQDEALAGSLRADTDALRKVTTERDALLAENSRLQDQLDAGTEAGWYALRNERDALRNRIANAPRLNITDMDTSSPGGRWIIRDSDMPTSVRGKVVALVEVTDDE